MFRKSGALAALVLLVGCAAGRPPAEVVPAAIEYGAWSLAPEPDEAQLEARGLRGRWVWELRRTSLRSLRGPQVYAWAITADQRRPLPLPAGVDVTDEIGAYKIGVELSPHERELRAINAQPGARCAFWLRNRLPALGNQSTGNP